MSHDLFVSHNVNDMEQCTIIALYNLERTKLDYCGLSQSCLSLNDRVGTADELPFPDGSVDLLTATTAAHWFDAERFIKEATRVLKLRGCLALFGDGDDMKIHYESCGDRLNNIYEEVSLFHMCIYTYKQEYLENRFSKYVNAKASAC